MSFKKIILQPRILKGRKKKMLGGEHSVSNAVKLKMHEIKMLCQIQWFSQSHKVEH